MTADDFARGSVPKGTEMKISTGSGDRGMTSLFSGERVRKNHARIEANGDVDELNSVLGAVAAALSEAQSETLRTIRQIQVDLMTMSAWLATTPGSPFAAHLENVSERSLGVLESALERMENELPELKGFVLPGGHISAAWAHVARTVCRRAERHVVALLEKPAADPAAGPLDDIIVYLNRLSDFLFILARHCNRARQVPEIRWP